MRSIFNYGRFYLDVLLPESVEIVMYLDTDTVLNKDLTVLFEDALHLDGSAPSNDLLNDTSLLGGKVFEDYTLVAINREKSYGFDIIPSQYLNESIFPIDFNEPTFNAGFWLLNLTTYRRENLRQKIFKEWLPKHKKETPLWNFGTQPLMLIAFYKKWYPLPMSFGVLDLGSKGWEVPEERKKEALVFHWNGPNKPWHAGDRSQKYLFPLLSHRVTVFS